ncbi:hypothetical protein [Nannocystis sp.]|uniref:hypothetical protein n=1 Tax=Nannocystis sp. TaxID=1962667 RepID=UPI0025F50B98|nr:hypothetical protein [Nannocystis sp.]
MATRTTSKQDPYTVSITRGGLALIASDTPLTRLHYFDGKRLRAADLTHEQSALRSWLMLSNQAGGAGVVHGFDCHLTGDRLNLGHGLAIDPDGRLLLLPDAAAISIATLLDAARGDPDPTPPKAKSGRFTHCEPVRVQPPGVTVEHVELWLITLSHAETACGSEDVFGNPCESACVSSTDRPYLVEGVLLRAVPLALKTPLPTASAIAITRLHLRSQIAAAYFADDRRRVSSLISGPGLRAETWCLGSKLVGGTDVPIAVLARAAGTTLFLDPWIPRRERIDPPPRQYWAARMAMRPWSGFLAEVLQFQCHLRDLLAEDPKRTPADPCAHTRATLRRTSDELRKLFNSYAAISERLIHGQPDDQPDLQDALARLERLQLDVAADNQRDALEPLDHILIHGGIVELPAAGYLPVQPGRDVELQVRRWLGDGLDLRFCIVRPDFVAHALEEAQHMDRISLLAGLDDPKAKPEVDILVPDGQLVPTTRHIGVEFTAKSRQDTRPNPTKGPAHAILLPQTHTAATAHGAGRTERLPGGGAALHLAGQLTPDPVHKLKPTTKPDTIPADEHSPDHNTPEVASLDPKMAAPGHTLAHTPPPTHLRGFLSATIDAHPADAAPGDRIPVHARLVVARSPGAPHLFDLDIDGTLHILTAGPRISAELTYAVNDAPAVIQPLELAWKPAPSGLLAAEITLERIGDPTITVELTLQWSPGAPHQVTATLVATSTAPMSPRQLVTEVHARFDHEPAVLEPTSPQHTTAIAVVDALAQAHDDKKFKPEALALLFPPPRAHTELVATRDWVQFHRRRTKQCITPPPNPPSTPAPAARGPHLPDLRRRPRRPRPSATATPQPPWRHHQRQTSALDPLPGDRHSELPRRLRPYARARRPPTQDRLATDPRRLRPRRGPDLQHPKLPGRRVPHHRPDPRRERHPRATPPRGPRPPGPRPLATATQRFTTGHRRHHHSGRSPAPHEGNHQRHPQLRGHPPHRPTRAEVDRKDHSPGHPRRDPRGADRQEEDLRQGQAGRHRRHRSAGPTERTSAAARVRPCAPARGPHPSRQAHRPRQNQWPGSTI